MQEYQQFLDDLPSRIQEQLQDVIDRAFERLRTAISHRKLYVMFEQQLHCDAQTDHLAPKNILPIYEKAIALAEMEIKALSYPAVLQCSQYNLELVGQQAVVQARREYDVIGTVLALQEQMTNFQMEMREYQKKQSRTEQKLLQQTHLNLEQAKKLITVDTYLPDRAPPRDDEDSEERQLRQFNKLLVERETTIRSLTEHVDRLRVELYNAERRETEAAEEVSRLATIIEATKDNVRIVEKVVTSVEYVPDPKVVQQLEQAREDFARAYETDDFKWATERYLDLFPSRYKQAQRRIKQHEEAARLQQEELQRGPAKPAVSLALNPKLNYIYDGTGQLVNLDSQLFTKLGPDLYKQIGTELVFHRYEKGERQFVCTAGDGSYFFRNRKGQTMQIVKETVCWVDEMGRYQLVDSVGTQVPRYLTRTGMLYQVDFYGNPYTFDVNNQKIPLDLAELKTNKLCQQPAVLERIAANQINHDFGTASSFYYKNQLRFLFDFPSRPSKEGLVYFDRESDTQFRPMKGFVFQKLADDWVLINRHGQRYFLVEGLYHTPQLYCTQEGNLMKFRDVRGRSWFVDIENRRYACKNVIGQLIIPSNPDEVERLLREQEAENEREAARLEKEARDAMVLQEKLEQERKDQLERELLQQRLVEADRGLEEIKHQAQELQYERIAFQEEQARAEERRLTAVSVELQVAPNFSDAIVDAIHEEHYDKELQVEILAPDPVLSEQEKAVIVAQKQQEIVQLKTQVQIQAQMVEQSATEVKRLQQHVSLLQKQLLLPESRVETLEEEESQQHPEAQWSFIQEDPGSAVFGCSETATNTSFVRDPGSVVKEPLASVSQPLPASLQAPVIIPASAILSIPVQSVMPAVPQALTPQSNILGHGPRMFTEYRGAKQELVVEECDVGAFFEPKSEGPICRVQRQDASTQVQRVSFTSSGVCFTDYQTQSSQHAVMVSPDIGEAAAQTQQAQTQSKELQTEPAKTREPEYLRMIQRLRQEIKQLMEGKPTVLVKPNAPEPPGPPEAQRQKKPHLAMVVLPSPVEDKPEPKKTPRALPSSLGNARVLSPAVGQNVLMLGEVGKVDAEIQTQPDIRSTAIQTYAKQTPIKSTQSLVAAGLAAAGTPIKSHTKDIWTQTQHIKQ